MDELFKALSDQQRRKILELLKQKDMTVTEIAEHFSITGASLSHHLSILKKARLIIPQREGQFIRYSLNTSVFEEVMKKLLSVFAKGN
jgi:DNA-binding transcriptional ArsR family regulator